MTRDDVRNQYFEWLCTLICDGGRTKRSSFRKLLLTLHDTEFTYLIQGDQNRSEDGVGLRYRFVTGPQRSGLDVSYIDCLDEPCSVLEMMVALSLRCEENIMDDPEIGNRTGQWFWGMIVHLGLGNMDDTRFNKARTTQQLATFLNREYTADGVGGLFIIRHCGSDLRDVEIWYQMCWYLNQFI